MVTRSAPGFLLGLFVEAGTVVAALAVRPRAGRMIFPVPVLSYLVGALISGFVFNRSGTSKTALAIGAAQWVANGFFAMMLATVLAVAIITTRWYLWRRGRPPAREVGRDTDWAAPAPAATRAAPPRRSAGGLGSGGGTRIPRGTAGCGGPEEPADAAGRQASQRRLSRAAGLSRADGLSPAAGISRGAGPRRGDGPGGPGTTRTHAAGRGPGRGRGPVPTTSPAGRSGAPGA